MLHSTFALPLGDDLASVLYYDLMRFKRPHSPYTVASILRVNNLNTVIITISFGSSFELCKWSIATLLGGQPAICRVAFIGHDAVMAVFATPVLGTTVALRGILLIGFPEFSGIANESI